MRICHYGWGMKVLTTTAFCRVLHALGDNPRVVTPGSAATPLEALHLIDEQLDRWTLFCVNAPVNVPTRAEVTHETIFVGPGQRHAGHVEFLPGRLSNTPDLLRTTRTPDLVVLHTTTPRNGQVSMGIEVQIMPAAVEAARASGGMVVAVMNPHMPFIAGDGVVSTDEIDYGIEIDAPLLTVDKASLDDASMTIGDTIAARMGEGATIQAGIGAVPDAVLSCLQQPQVDSHPGLRSVTTQRHLGVWTELIGDGVREVDDAGVLDPDRPIVGTFLIGGDELYEWAGRQTRLQLLRCERTNDPGTIARQPAMTSVNTAMQVDLFGQVNASRIGTRIFSGTGGATDFLVGALHSPGGQALVAMRSWHLKAGVSTIVDKLDAPVTSVQPTAVVTEQGVAELFGNSEREQARQLIENAAHPQARSQLRQAAARYGL